MRSKRITVAVVAGVVLLAALGVFAFGRTGPDGKAEAPSVTADGAGGNAEAAGDARGADGSDTDGADSGSDTHGANGSGTNGADGAGTQNADGDPYVLAAKDDSAANGRPVSDGGNAPADDPGGGNDPAKGPDPANTDAAENPGGTDGSGTGPEPAPAAEMPSGDGNGPAETPSGETAVTPAPKPDGDNAEDPGNGNAQNTGGTDPYAGDPGGDPANGGTVSDGVPSQPHSPVTVPDDGSGDPAVHTGDVDLPALFAPVSKSSDPGADGAGLPAFLAGIDPSFMRDETDEAYRLIGYDAGDVYEIQDDAEGAIVTVTYRYPTGQTSRRRDLVYDESKERPRVFAVLEYLFPEQAEAVRNDFTAMRHWQESYLRAYGLPEIDWSAFVRSRYYGTRYCLMSVTRDTVTVTVYPAGYRDELGDFAANGSYREFYTYPPGR